MSKATSARERWAASFDLSRHILYPLERNEDLDLKLYISKDKVIQNRWNPRLNTEDPLGRNPVYHVWHGDRWVYCGQSIVEAYQKYIEIEKCGGDLNV